MIILLTVLSMVTFGSAKGNDARTPSSLEVSIVLKDEVYKVEYRGLSKKYVVNITDSRGAVIFTESINGHMGFVRPYNLKKLPKGVYTISVIEGSNVTKEEIYHRIEREIPIAVADSTLREIEAMILEDYRIYNLEKLSWKPLIRLR